MARPTASSNASLNGTVNGATTLVAIKVAPAGSLWIRGSATKVNSWFMYMAQGMKQMPTANISLSRRSRNSNKCEIRVPSASSPGSPASLMGRLRRGYGRIGCVHGRRGGGGRRQSAEDGVGLARRRSRRIRCWRINRRVRGGRGSDARRRIDGRLRKGGRCVGGIEGG